MQHQQQQQPKQHQLKLQLQLKLRCIKQGRKAVAVAVAGVADAVGCWSWRWKWNSQQQQQDGNNNCNLVSFDFFCGFFYLRFAFRQSPKIKQKPTKNKTRPLAMWLMIFTFEFMTKMTSGWVAHPLPHLPHLLLMLRLDNSEWTKLDSVAVCCAPICAISSRREYVLEANSCTRRKLISSIC